MKFREGNIIETLDACIHEHCRSFIDYPDRIFLSVEHRANLMKEFENVFSIPAFGADTMRIRGCAIGFHLGDEQEVFCVHKKSTFKFS